LNYVRVLIWIATDHINLQWRRFVTGTEAKQVAEQGWESVNQANNVGEPD
jgi:hypothetical protein